MKLSKGILRRRVCIPVLLCSILFLGGGCGGSGDDAAFSMREAARYARELLEAYASPSVSVALVEDGSIVWARAFGTIDRRSGAVPTPETLFGIGSTSKVIATTAAMILVDRGLVSLDVPLAAYVSGFSMQSPEAADVTVRMLLNHSSGFPGTDYRKSVLTTRWDRYADGVLETLRSSHLKHAPGAMNIYCNDGFTLVEKLVSSVTGKDYATFVQEEIFTPLGMTHSRYPTAPFAGGSYAPDFYSDGSPKPQEYNNTFASGGLYTTPSDLCRFLAMFAGGGELHGVRVLSEASVRAMGEDQTVGKFRIGVTKGARYGLGWDTVGQPGIELAERTAWAKNGETGVYGSCVIVIPDLKLGVAVTGVSGIKSNQATALAERVLLAALVERGLLSEMPATLSEAPKMRAPAPDLAAYLPGFYASTGGLLRMEQDASGRLSILARSDGAWTPYLQGLAYRANGYFSSDDDPNTEFAFAEGRGMRYAVNRGASVSRLYQDEAPMVQKIEPGAPLSAAWTGRLSRTWLLVNMPHTFYTLDASWYPCLALEALPELPGALFVKPQSKEQYFLVRPESDTFAAMGVTIPGGGGRDQNELVVTEIDGEEWMRFGSCRFRPLETVPVLSADIARDVTVGASGDGEWLRLDPASTGATLTVTPRAGEGRWMLFDTAFACVADSDARGTGPFPAAPRGGYLHLMGDSGARFAVILAAPEA